MADKFYTPMEGASADWTSSSKGYKANSLFGDIAAGVGDAIKMGSTAADNYFKGMVKEDSDKATKDLFKQYGNDAAVDTNAGILSPTNTPSIGGIQKGAEQLALMKQAVANGTLKDTSFWAQAELISRQLKMRYPGYWEEVDQAMSQATGRKPAIALHSELMQELSANKNHEELKRDFLLKQAMEVGDVAVLQAEGTDKKYSNNDIATRVAAKNSIKWDQENRGRQYNLDKEEKTLTEDKVYKTAAMDTQSEIMAALSTASSPFARNVAEFRASMERANAATESGQAVSTGEKARLMALKGQIDQYTNDIYNKYLLKYGADADPEKLKKYIQPIKDWADTFTEGVVAGKTGLVERDASLLKSLEDADLFRFFQQNDAVRKFNAVRKAIGEPAALNFWTAQSGSKWLNDTNVSIVNYLESDVMLTGKPLKETTQQMMDLGVKDAKAFDEHLNRTMNAVVSNDITPDLKANALNSLYGEGNKDFLKERIPEGNRIPYFLKMTSPVMVTSIQKLRDAGQITQENYDQHMKWIAENAIQLLSDEAPEINSISQSRKMATVYYDATTGKLVPGKNPNYAADASTKVGKIVAHISENFQSSMASGAVERANKVLDRIKLIYDKTGQSDNYIGTAMVLLQQAGIDIAFSGTDKSKMGKTGAEPLVNTVEEFVGGIREGLNIMGDPTKYDTSTEQGKASADALNIIFGGAQ